MKTYGSVELKDGFWHVKAEPQVLIRIKRVFEQIDKRQHGTVMLADTEANCRELLWFLERYPMEVKDLGHLKAQTEEHLARERLIFDVSQGDYVPPSFSAMAVPPREYQKIAADLALKTGRLLLSDDLGCGKSCSFICTLTDPSTLPTLVVTMTHLTGQWRDEVKKFLPNLRVHIITSGKPYDICKDEDGKSTLFPDVIIMNYHKMSGWADTLAPSIRSVCWDEVAELRRSESHKYTAAKHFAKYASYRVGLSGSPIFNLGGEIFNVIDVLSPDALGTREEFNREWCQTSYQDKKPKLRDPKAFGSMLREQGLMLRRTRQDIGRELPALTNITHTVDSDLEELEKVGESVAELAKIILSQANLPKGAKLQAGGELSWKLRHATGLAKSSYVAEFVKMLIETGESVVLFGWHRDVYSVWQDKLRKYRPAMYTGAETVQQKDRAKRRFISGDTKLLIMSLRAGIGLDGLQGVCCSAIFGELDFSPAVHMQNTGRLLRDGQIRPVFAYYLVSEHGSDPVLMDILNVKAQQLHGIRDPYSSIIEDFEQDDDKIRKLAEYVLGHAKGK